jgi:hypothetical protein
MTSRDQILGEVGRGEDGRESVSGLDGRVVDPTVANNKKLWGGELRMILCDRKLSFVVRNWDLFYFSTRQGRYVCRLT